jgi:hypothetical protein
MQPGARELIGAGLLALLLFGLVAVIVVATWANADPAASHEAAAARLIVA